MFGNEWVVFADFVEEILAVNWGKGELTQVQLRLINFKWGGGGVSLHKKGAVRHSV